MSRLFFLFIAKIVSCVCAFYHLFYVYFALPLLLHFFQKQAVAKKLNKRKMETERAGRKETEKIGIDRQRERERVNRPPPDKTHENT